jgi:hypothetical protein
MVPVIHVNEMYSNGYEEEPDRSNVYVAVFPKDTNTNQLVTHFSTFGKVRVRWINDISAWITFDETPNAPVTGMLCCYGL